MKNLLMLVLLISWISGMSQIFEPKWESCYGGIGWDEGLGLTELNDNYYIVGRTESFEGDISHNHGLDDVWFLEIDSLGNLLMEKTLGGMKSDGGHDIRKLNDSVFYITAMTNSSDGDISNNLWPESNSCIWVLQVDTQGEIIWEKVHGGSKIDWMRDMEITNDGGVLCLCLTTSDDGDVSNPNGGWDMWLFKLNSSGEMQWEMSLGGEGSDNAGGVIQTQDMGYLVVGNTNGYGGGNYDTTCNYHGVPGGWKDAWIIKLDSLRNIEWQQCYGGSYHEWATNIIELVDGYIILGTTESNDGDVSGFNGIVGDPYSGSDIWVFKIDKQSNLIWQKCLGGSYYEWARNIFPTTDGGIMVVGSTQSDDGDVEGFNGIQAGGWDDVWFTKLDSLGNLVWQYCYGNLGEEYLYRGVIQKSDWNYVLTLATNSNEWQCSSETNLKTDLRIVELYDTTVGITENKTENLSVEVFPNPATERVKFKYKLPSGQTQGKLTIYSSSGILIRGFVLMAMQGQIVYNTSTLPNGVYFYTVVAGGKKETGKFVVVE